MGRGGDSAGLREISWFLWVLGSFKIFEKNCRVCFGGVKMHI